MRHSLGWDWGAGEARWVELVEERGRPVVRAFGTVEVRAGDGGAVVGAVREPPLRALVAQRRWRGREVVAALPRTAVTLTWMSLPAAGRDDLAGMVELEAAQVLPFPVEEAAWDFAAGPAMGASQPVLLVAARRQIAEERRLQVEETGLHLGTLSVDVLAAAALLRSAHPEHAHGGVLVCLDGDSLTLAYVRDDRVLMSRTVERRGGEVVRPWEDGTSSPPPHHPTAAPPHPGWDAPTLALEVRRTLVAGAAASGGASAPEEHCVWLTGDGAEANLAAALGVALRGSGDTDRRVALLPRDGIEGAEDLPRALDQALGLALLGLRASTSAPWDGIDLAHRVRAAAEAAAPRAHPRLRVLVGAGVAAVGVALFLFAGSSGQDRALARAATRAQAEARQLATRQGELEACVRDLSGAIAPRHSYLDILNAVSGLAGSDLWLTQFTYDRGRPIILRGSARSSTAVARLVEGLRASPHLATVNLGAMTESVATKTPVVQFMIQCGLRGDAPLEAPRRRRAARQPGKTGKERP